MAGLVLLGPAIVGSLALAAGVAERAGVVVLPGSAPRYRGPKGREADLTEVLLTGEQSSGTLGLFRQDIAPRNGPPVHVHADCDEVLYVVSGDFEVKMGEKVTHVPARTVLFVPRGTPHTFVNAGTARGELLVGVTPAGLESMFKEREGVDADRAAAIMRAHRTDVVGPPLR